MTSVAGSECDPTSVKCFLPSNFRLFTSALSARFRPHDRGKKRCSDSFLRIAQLWVASKLWRAAGVEESSLFFPVRQVASLGARTGSSQVGALPLGPVPNDAIQINYKIEHTVNFFPTGDGLPDEKPHECSNRKPPLPGRSNMERAA